MQGARQEEPLRLLPAEGAFLRPKAPEVARILRAWIRDAQEGGAAPEGASKQDNARFLFGALVLPGRGDAPAERLQVFVHRKRMLADRQRFILLHVHSQEIVPPCDPKEKQEMAFVYFTAATGTLHGFHVEPQHRGRGLMKQLYLYYTLFCREFGLPAVDTARNKKPLFAKLYQEMGYEPCCRDFPFLLFDERDENGCVVGQHVRPLAPEEPTWAQAENRGGAQWQGDTNWNISRKSAKSQGFGVLQAAGQPAFDGAEETDLFSWKGALPREDADGGLQLYAKTEWRLPLGDEAALERREARLRALAQRARCLVYVDGEP